MTAISNEYPPPGATLRPGDAIGFDAVLDVAPHLASFTVLLASNVRETLWAAGAFGPQYAAHSSVITLGDGTLRFLVRRTAGWPSTFTLETEGVASVEFWAWGEAWGG